MTDDQKAQETPVNETQESPMPSEEQKTEEVKAPEQVAPEREEAVQEQAELPEDVKERTKREFDKLRRELREERVRREYTEKVFQSLQARQPKGPALSPMIDPETGLLNDKAITERDRLLLEAQERAKRAEEAIVNYQHESENREMYRVHPELDPSSHLFDEELHDQTRMIALDSMVNPGKYGDKQLSGVEAAKKAKEILRKARESSRQGGTGEVDNTPKEQAALEASGSSGRRSQVEPKLDELRYKSRKGGEEGLEAIVERLKNVPDQS